MAINLPQDGYSAMMLVNQLANHDAVAGVSYDVADDKKGNCVLKKIIIFIGPEIKANRPSKVDMARSGMMKLGGG